jgi:hypothetical protein
MEEAWRNLSTFEAQVCLNNSVRTAKKTLHFTIAKINWLTLFKEIIPVYSENDIKSINTYTLWVKLRISYC